MNAGLHVPLPALLVAQLRERHRFALVHDGELALRQQLLRNHERRALILYQVQQALVGGFVLAQFFHVRNAGALSPPRRHRIRPHPGRQRGRLVVVEQRRGEAQRDVARRHLVLAALLGNRLQEVQNGAQHLAVLVRHEQQNAGDRLVAQLVREVCGTSKSR